MNRLKPLVSRRPLAPRLALAAPRPARVVESLPAATSLVSDARQFLLAWAGGLVFFLTLLG